MARAAAPDENRHHETERHADVGQAGHEAAPLAVMRFHGKQHGATPFATDADALQEAKRDEEPCRGRADRTAGGQAANQERGDAHQEERGDQRRLAADAVAHVPE